jgi:hypothetical protein
MRLTLLGTRNRRGDLGGRKPAKLLEDLLRRFPVSWREQRAEKLDRLGARPLN